MTTPKILIGTSSFSATDPAPLNMLREAGVAFTLNPLGRKLTKAELLPLLQGMDGLIAGLETVDREVLERSTLKVVSRCGSGMANVDMSAAKELGIAVYGVPDGPTLAVAELTVGCLLTLIRQVTVMDRALHRKAWDKRTGRQLQGMKILIVGYGRIGRTTARMLQGLGVEILAFDPKLNDPEAPLVSDLWEALSACDGVILHNSGEDEILNHEAFGRMKKGMFVLNASRGQAVNEGALIAALDCGTVAGAWLDTFVTEPYSGPLCGYEQVLLTPHVASYTHEGRVRMECETVANLLRGLRVGH
ncbi:MAG: hydroxyacid dehydrogenase [Nitrospirae bacterium]|nr:hydroxyacid dehydrogenase [Magnetococcales bacterium]HAT51101.1 hydroxyacid dehydrogenase [Alphaproteobacteria bacterium]